LCVSYNFSDSQVLNCATPVVRALKLDSPALTVRNFEHVTS